MAQNDLAKRLEQSRRKMLIYKHQWPTATGRQALKFVDSNFSSQGWKGDTLLPWRHTKNGKRQSVLGGKSQGILIKTGKLRRGMRMLPMGASVKIYNRVKYARVHNEGFKGTVNVREYTRRRFGKGSLQVGDMNVSFGESYSTRTKRKLKNKKVVTDTVRVKAHTMKMNIPMRQFMPNSRRQSAILNREIKEATIKGIQRCFKR